MKSFDKSTIPHYLLVLIFALAAIAAHAQQATPVHRAAGQGVRFTLVFSPHTPPRTYLLDTETGRVWQAVQAVRAEGEPTLWKFMDRVDNADEYLEWLQQQRPKTPATR